MNQFKWHAKVSGKPKACLRTENLCIIEVDENYGLLFKFTSGFTFTTKYFFNLYLNLRKLDNGYNNYRMIQYRGWLLFIPELANIVL